MKLRLCLLAFVVPVAIPKADAAPRFATVDAPGNDEAIFVDPGLTVLPDHFALRLGFRIEQHLGTGAGVAVDMAFSHLNGDPDDYNAFNNLALWGFARLGGNKGNWIGRVGIVVPSGSDGAGKILANVVTHLQRLQDYSQAVPGAVALRAGGTGMQQFEKVYLRCDLGLDVFLKNDGGNTIAPFVHANGAVAFNAGSAWFALEMANLFSFDDYLSNDLLSTIALTAYFPRDFYVSAVVPLDNPYRGDYWTLTAGIAVGR